MRDFLLSRWFKVLSGCALLAGLGVLCDKYPAQAAKFAVASTALAAALPSALAGAKASSEDGS